MKNKDSNQIWWVVSLLAAAVILPTVCLLWFMTTAVRNERLAVRQRLIDVYQSSLKKSAQEKLGFDTINRQMALDYSEAFVVYDNSGKITFPAADTSEEISSNSEFDQAYELEYKNNDPNKAIDEYRRIAQSAKEDTLRIYADISLARCLHKLKHENESIEVLRAILSRYDNSNQYLHIQKSYAYLLLLELSRQKGDKNFVSDLSDAFDYVFSGMMEDNHYSLSFLGRKPNVNDYIPTPLQIFMLQKCIAYAQDIPLEAPLERKYKYSQRFIRQASASLQVADECPKPDFASDPNIINSRIFRLDTQQPLYGVYRTMNGYVGLMTFTPQYIASWFDPFLDDMRKLPSECCIYDEKGTLAAGPEIPSGRKPFIKTQLASDYFPGWTVGLYIDDSAFETAAGRQQMVYVWSSVLVIGLMMGLVFLAGREILHQARLNTMKNNFVATVTHELKTPLSSMRLLVDTLLEGNYTNQQQCREYLELISRENHRLSRMIDSFLTFSRMERGKQVFDFASVSPADIASAAVEAVQTKLNANQCKFSVTMSPELPTIYADKDAMVTAVINLLDNACKYSGDNKQIELNVYRDSGQSKNGCLCFAVRDNGIGMTRRQMRRIFDKFYQVDSSLARRAEGCGLGLSIVKYIVDAHKGTIEVDSKVESGSSFVVCIPIEH